MPTPARQRPVSNEARIRQVGRLPHVVFHSDGLNSPFFRQVPVERRCEALHRVLDLLLRALSKGMGIGSAAITVTGKRGMMTLTPDCACVRTLNPPRPGGNNDPSLYRARNWSGSANAPEGRTWSLKLRRHGSTVLDEAQLGGTPAGRGSPIP